MPAQAPMARPEMNCSSGPLKTRYWGLGRIGMGRAVACLGSIVVAVLVYVVLIIVLKVLTYEDCLLLPKGEKIAKILRVR